MSNYNLESVKEMAGGDEEFIEIVVRTFLEEIPPDLKAMNEAIEEQNATLSYQYAHKMKPNFEMFGLNLMPQIRTIEAWSKSGEKNEEVIKAAAIIDSKVTAAIKELKSDFSLE